MQSVTLFVHGPDRRIYAMRSTNTKSNERGEFAFGDSNHNRTAATDIGRKKISFYFLLFSPIAAQASDGNAPFIASTATCEEVDRDQKPHGGPDAAAARARAGGA